MDKVINNEYVYIPYALVTLNRNLSLSACRLIGGIMFQLVSKVADAINEGRTNIFSEDEWSEEGYVTIKVNTNSLINRPDNYGYFQETAQELSEQNHENNTPIFTNATRCKGILTITISRELADKYFTLSQYVTLRIRTLKACKSSYTARL